MIPTIIKTDTTYAKWFVTTTRRTNPGKTKATQHWCRCECGTERWVNASDIVAGRSTNCGCVRRAKVAARNQTHGKTFTKEYVIWAGMIARCHNVNHKGYARYGGRGIQVCPRWREAFAAFFEDMGPAPFPKATVDRIDNDIGYEPGNCRWVSNKANCRNAPKAIKVMFRGETKALNDWADELGLPHRTIQARVRRGWPVDKALSTPVASSAK